MALIKMFFSFLFSEWKMVSDVNLSMSNLNKVHYLKMEAL